MNHSAMTTARRFQRGFSLVAAIFMLVILAAIGAFMVTIGTVEHATAAYAAQGTRAYQAAQAGIEWGIFGALTNRTATCGATQATPTTATLNPLAPGLNGFAVTVVCSYTDHQEAGVTGSSIPSTPNQFKVFSIVATATYGPFGSSNFFSRTVEVTVTDAP